MKHILSLAAMLFCTTVLADGSRQERLTLQNSMDIGILQLEQTVAREGFESRRFFDEFGRTQIMVRAPLIKFRSGDSGVSARESLRLGELAEVVKGQPFRILVVGHAEDSTDENWIGGLSDSRALAVSEELQRYGVSGGQLVVMGMGNTQPLAETSHGRERNRRVEITVVSNL